MDSKPTYLGHRRRVQARFRENGLAAFQDYEALELLLMFVMRQADVKPPAKRLIKRFGTFKAVLDAPEAELLAVKGVGPAAVTLIWLVKESATRYLQQTSLAQFSAETPESLIDYCRAAMGALPDEQFRVLCLDSKFALVADRVVAEGTLDEAAVYPRKVMEIALAAHAATLVFVHNHPSGHPAPSEMDRILTRNLAAAAKVMNVRVHDHLIVTADAYYSFREAGLI